MARVVWKRAPRRQRDIVTASHDVQRSNGAQRAPRGIYSIPRTALARPGPELRGAICRLVIRIMCFSVHMSSILVFPAHSSRDRTAGELEQWKRVARRVRRRLDADRRASRVRRDVRRVRGPVFSAERC